jgi:hypothetical protein
MIARGIQQTGANSPKITIDCVLASESTRLQADGCVLERSGDGHKLISPDHLRAGDLVKVQLWLEGEEAFVDIRLAEVKKVHKHWIEVEVIQVSQNDRIRFKRFIDALAAMQVEEPPLIDHLLIRA